MRVLKFGGSSVGNVERIRQVGVIVCEYLATQQRLAVVVSAFERVTDALLETARIAASGDVKFRDALRVLESRHIDTAVQLINIHTDRVAAATKKTCTELGEVLEGIFLLREASPRALDIVASFGERLSAYIISESLRSIGKDACFVDAREFIRTDSRFGSASVDFNKTNPLIKAFFEQPRNLYVITGFIGSDSKGETTTLGRGGSDYTASIIAAALSADEIEIWTDVDGVLSADPRKVKHALQVKSLTYEEAMELSHFGAKVIHPPTMLPALRAEIPIRIKNTFNPRHPGTFISALDLPTPFPVKGISSVSAVALFRLEGSGMVGVPGVASRLFGVLAREKISVILISQASSEHTICFAIAPEAAQQARELINQEFALEIRSGLVDPLIVESDLSIMAVVGENMRHTPGIAGKLFHTLGKNGINVVAIAQGSSELNISVVIGEKDEVKGLNAVHDTFFLSDIKTQNLFVVGTGQVGSRLIEMLREQSRFLEDDRALRFRLVGVANSKHMLFSEEGTSLHHWKEQLSHSSLRSDIRKFVEKIAEFNLPHSIFVDCTASETLADQYEKILQRNISIVTPNKRANSGSWERYVQIMEARGRSTVRYLYETTVGAGLPVIGTLHDLLSSGDKILRIEAVLSGTLSYIFNSLCADTCFSAIVKKARELGFTEPDPRDDLSGKDVARKLLILGREMGLELEESAVEVESLVPQACRELNTVDEFLQALPRHDHEFESMRAVAEAQGKKLRYVASIAQGAARVRLEALPAAHPFYDLSGSDNIISFTSARYSERPLVVRGPGAGVDVTAAGVFADILKVSNYLV